MSQIEENSMPSQPTDVEGANSLSAAQDETNKKEFRMQTPPPDWDYRRLLKDIAEAMTVDNVKVAKSMFKGEFKSKLSEKIVDAIDLFDILEKRGFLDSNNLLYLQSLLDHVNRHDLFELVANFASETLQNAVYFQKQPDEPAPGHKYVYFHIKGHDFADLYKRSSLEDLRAKAAKIMGVLPKNILFPGIQLSESVLVTMMISLEHIDCLVTALKKSTCRNDLASLGVDEVRIDTERWSIEGLEEYEVVQSEQQAKQQKRIRKLHEELEKCKDMLQKREIEMIDLKKAMGEQANKNEELNQLKHELIHAKDMLKNKEKNLKEKEIEITKLEEEIYQLSDRTVQMSASLYRIEQSLKESNFVNHRMETGSDIVQNDEEIKGLSSKTDRQSILNWIIMVAIVSNVLQVVLSLVGRYY